MLSETVRSAFIIFEAFSCVAASCPDYEKTFWRLGRVRAPWHSSKGNWCAEFLFCNCNLFCKSAFSIFIFATISLNAFASSTLFIVGGSNLEMFSLSHYFLFGFIFFFNFLPGHDESRILPPLEVPDRERLLKYAPSSFIFLRLLWWLMLFPL